jgi:hypothetical protein
MDWKAIVSVFASPIGAVINKGLAAGSAAFIGWATAKGLPADSATSIASMVVLGLSTVITGFASSQGIQIPIINADVSNGVKVVPMSSPTPSVNAPNP